MENLKPHIHYCLALKDNIVKLWGLQIIFVLNIPYKLAQKHNFIFLLQVNIDKFSSIKFDFVWLWLCATFFSD